LTYRSLTILQFPISINFWFSCKRA